MKKFLLSTIVIASFVVYMFYQNVQARPIVVRPQIALNSSNGSIPSISPATPSIQSETTNPSVPTSTQTPPPPVQTGKFRNGTYVGSVADAFYGNVQVKVTVSGGKISDVQFLDYPQDRNTSRMINSQAIPYLISEAISVQSANVDIISGATDTSMAFQQSLSDALSQATI